MKSTSLLLAPLLAAALMAGCNGDGNGSPSVGPIVQPTPSPITAITTTVTDLATSLIAMVTGSSCATAAPADVNGASLSADETPVDANGITPACG